MQCVKETYSIWIYAWYSFVVAGWGRRSIKRLQTTLINDQSSPNAQLSSKRWRIGFVKMIFIRHVNCVSSDIITLNTANNLALFRCFDWFSVSKSSFEGVIKDEQNTHKCLLCSNEGRTHQTTSQFNVIIFLTTLHCASHISSHLKFNFSLSF